MRRPQYRRPRRRTLTVIAETLLDLLAMMAVVALVATIAALVAVDRGDEPQSMPQPSHSIRSDASPPSMTDPTPYTGDATCTAAPTAANPYAGCLYNKVQGIRLTINPDGTATLIGGGLAACGVPDSLGSYASRDCPQTVDITFSGPFMASKIVGTITKTTTTSATPVFGQEGDVIDLATTKATGLFQLHIQNIGGLSMCRAENELQLGECSTPES